MFTGAGETLRLSGVDEDISTGDRYDAIRPRVLRFDRATGADEIRKLVASPEFVVNSVAAAAETGSLVLASGSGSQLPANVGGAAHAVWIVGGQKVVPDLSTCMECPAPQPAAHPQRGTPSGARHRAASARGHRVLNRLRDRLTRAEAVSVRKTTPFLNR